MVYYFIGAFCALLLTVGLILDLERKRQALRNIVLRLEQITSRRTRSRIHHLRRLTLSMFLYEQVLRQLDQELATLEQERGLEPQPLTKRDFYLLERRLRQLRERVERLAATAADPV